MRIGSFALAAALSLAATTAEAGGSAALAVSAVVLSKADCRFQTASNTMAFGDIDPDSSGAVFRTVSYRFRCTGPAARPVTFALSDDFGLYESGPGARRMRHSSNPSEFLPYTLTYPSSMSVARNVIHTISVTGTLTPSDFQDAALGTYADTVTLTIIP